MRGGKPPVIFGRVAERVDGDLGAFLVYRVRLTAMLAVEVYKAKDRHARRVWYAMATVGRDGETSHPLVTANGLLTRSSAIAAIEAKTREVLAELRAVRV